jgi:hypothetical protein
MLRKDQNAVLAIKLVTYYANVYVKQNFFILDRVMMSDVK